MSGARLDTDELEVWSMGEICEALGLKRETIYYHRRENGFPEPWRQLAVGPIWLAADVLEWRAGDKG